VSNKRQTNCVSVYHIAIVCHHPLPPPSPEVERLLPCLAICFFSSSSTTTTFLSTSYPERRHSSTQPRESIVLQIVPLRHRQMPPIMTSEQRARSVQASPAQKPYPRGFVAAVPTSPAPLSPLSPPALQPPPPSHYFRNRNRSSEDSALFRKRSEIYTRVQRVLPPALHAEDSASGLLFGSDFHADWSNSQFGRPPLSSPRFVVAVPIHAAHTPAAPPSAQPPSVSVQSNSNLYDMPLSRDEDDDTPEVSSSVPSHASNKERPSRRPLRALLRERLTVKVRSRSVEAASATQPTASTDDLPRYSTELG